MPVRDEVAEQRLVYLDKFTTTPHGNIGPLYRLLQQVYWEDPDFYAHLAVWAFDPEKARDHTHTLIAILCKAPLLADRLSDVDFARVIQAEHRDVGVALLKRLNPKGVWSVLGIIKEYIKTDPGQKAGMIPKKVWTGVQEWWDLQEMSPDWDRNLLSNRRFFYDIGLWGRGYLYMSERTWGILYERDYPAGSLFELVNSLDDMDVETKARLLVEHNIPMLVASSFLPEGAPETWIVKVHTATPAQLIGMWPTLEEAGAFSIPGLLEVAEAKAAKAKTDKRVQAAKVKHMGIENKAVRDVLASMYAKYRAKLTRTTGILVDVSGSMHTAVKIAADIAEDIAQIAMYQDEDGNWVQDMLLPVVFFNTLGALVWVNHNNVAATFDRASMRVGGGTAIGAGVDTLIRNNVDVDQLIIITDGQENGSPRFSDKLHEYTNNRDINVIVIKVGHYRPLVETVCNQLDVPCLSLDWRAGDYTAKENLFKLLTGKAISIYDVIMEIMDTPLPI